MFFRVDILCHVSAVKNVGHWKEYFVLFFKLLSSSEFLVWIIEGWKDKDEDVKLSVLTIKTDQYQPNSILLNIPR